MLLPTKKSSSSHPCIHSIELHHEISGDRDENNNIINNKCNKPVILIKREKCDVKRFEESSREQTIMEECDKENDPRNGGQSEDEDRKRLHCLNERIEVGFKRRKNIKSEKSEIKQEENKTIKGDNDGITIWNGYYFIRDGDFDVVKFNVFVFIIGHLLYFHALYLLLSGHVMVLTYVHCFWMTNWAGVGIGSGAHRLWAHKSYEARSFFKTFLMIGQLMAGQNCLYIWCRDHRVHHKWSDTDADPHNTLRGFFFSHVGWLLRKKHPEMRRKGRTLDFSDLTSDPVVKFQSEHYWMLYFFVAILIPVIIPVYLWNESWTVSFFICYILRYVTSLHCTWFVNSSAHMFGARPYNGIIAPRENYWVSFGSFGEGYHNYHHTFPRDYATSELPYFWNINKIFIETFAKMGQAHNLKKPSQNLIEKVKIKEQERELRERERKDAWQQEHHHHHHSEEMDEDTEEEESERIKDQRIQIKSL